MSCHAHDTLTESMVVVGGGGGHYLHMWTRISVGTRVWCYFWMDFFTSVLTIRYVYSIFPINNIYTPNFVRFRPLCLLFSNFARSFRSHFCLCSDHSIPPPPHTHTHSGGWNAIRYQILDPLKSEILVKYQIFNPHKIQISHIKVPPFHHPRPPHSGYRVSLYANMPFTTIYIFKVCCFQNNNELH